MAVVAEKPQTTIPATPSQYVEKHQSNIQVELQKE